MATEVIITILGILGTAITGTVTFILTKRKYNTEVDSQQIKNMSDAFDAYKKMMEEALDSQKKTFEETINSQNKKIETLQRENDNLRSQFSQLQAQMVNLLIGEKLGITNIVSEPDKEE